MRKIIIIPMLFLLFSACAAFKGEVTTRIIDPTTKLEWKIISRSDALVTFQNAAGDKLTVDLRGGKNLIEELIQLSAMKTNVNIGEK